MASVRVFYNYALKIYYNGLDIPIVKYFKTFSEVLSYLCTANNPLDENYKYRGDFSQIEIYDIRPF